MRFGKSAKEAKEEANRATSNSDFIRYLKDGDNTMRILQEPHEWVYYWEHFGQNRSYPCTNERDCPGCNSPNEKEAKAGRKIAFNVLTSYNNQPYVNAFKVGTMVADKLENRYDRLGTITDRDYTITRYKTTGDRYDFDVEGSVPSPIDPKVVKEQGLKDIESLLQEAWDEVWGSQPPQDARAASNGSGEVSAPKRATIAPAADEGPDEPPFEESVYQEADLRKMDLEDLLALVKRDMNRTPPDVLKTSDKVVDWLLRVQAEQS